MSGVTNWRTVNIFFTNPYPQSTGFKIFMIYINKNYKCIIYNLCYDKKLNYSVLNKCINKY